MTQTLTTERLREIVEDGFLEHGDAKSMAREILANRDTQPVAYLKKSIIDSDRFDSADPEIILHPNTPEGWLSEYQAVFAAPPALAVPDICSTAVNDAAWKLHDTLTEHGPLNGHQFNNLKGCFYEALKIVMNAVPAPIVPVMICDKCGHDADHQGNRTYKCDNGHVFHMRREPVSQGYKLPPHAYRELVNTLRDTAAKYTGTDQLRERLNTALSQFIEPDHPHTRTVTSEGGNDPDTRR